MRPDRLVAIVALVLLIAANGGCKKLKARDRLNKGVAAYRNAQFQQAIQHFKQAVDLDPTLLNAKLYLATAYASQYIPGGESAENIKVGEQAIAQFEEVLKVDPSNTSSLAGTASIYYNMRKFDKAKEYQRRLLQIEPNNPEPYYWIGVINWATAYPARMKVRADFHLVKPEEPIPAKERASLAEENGKLVEEGIQALQKAIELRPNYSDAMAYLNLMLREKADLEEDRAAREADFKQADEWVQKALAVKKAVAEKRPG